jgi:hypothetical protein
MSVQKQHESGLVNLKYMATVVFGVAPLIVNACKPELKPGFTEGMATVSGVTVMPAGVVCTTSILPIANVALFVKEYCRM